MPTRLTLRSELLAMRDQDLSVRQVLLQADRLSDGYHPEMEAVHRRNAARLREIIAHYGWPTRTLVGVDGEEAASLVVQHAIGDPELQQTTVSLLQKAVNEGEAPAWQLAFLTDRIAFFEGRPQRYGTQLDYDAEGYSVVYALEDPNSMDELRRSVGLEPLANRVPPREQQTPMNPDRLREYRAGYESWLKSTGWRK